jgi:hypothetical protein
VAPVVAGRRSVQIPALREFRIPPIGELDNTGRRAARPATVAFESKKPWPGEDGGIQRQKILQAHGRSDGVPSAQMVKPTRSMASGFGEAVVAVKRVAAAWMTWLGITLGGLTMTHAQVAEQAGFHTVLAAPGRSSAIPESMDVYGWLVGSWDLAVLRYRGIDVSARGLKGEVHFGWVLEGRAIQDVWIMPPRAERTGNEEPTQNMYGTTFLMWDPAIQAWRITWKNPAGGHYEEQIGRRIGADIVQAGARPNGTPTRWTFTEITPDSFRWLGEALEPDGQTWKLEGEFRARRLR